MLPFNLKTLEGLAEEFKPIVSGMLKGIPNLSGTGFFTLHGKKLKANQTLRRGGPHTDGSYCKTLLSWGAGGGNGWKVGENGPSVETNIHKRLYNSKTGGIILTSNYEACQGWEGEYDGLPGVGGDCSHLELGKPFNLDRGKVYYGNNHFIHESLPVSEDCHRVFARITLPEDHQYN